MARKWEIQYEYNDLADINRLTETIYLVDGREVTKGEHDRTLHIDVIRRLRSDSIRPHQTITKDYDEKRQHEEEFAHTLIVVTLTPCCVTCKHHKYGGYPDEPDRCQKHTMSLEDPYEVKCGDWEDYAEV